MLRKIVEAKRKRLTALDRVAYLRYLETLLQHPLPLRSFREAISVPGLSIIAEFKRQSPSAGMIAAAADPVAQAKMYQASGAKAISILTEQDHFGGSLEDLKHIKAAVQLPVLRKDFILEPLQALEARAYGADAVLLITGLLGAGQMKVIMAEAGRLGIDCLCEVHSEKEIRIAVDCGADIIGINNRDLVTFAVDLSTTRRLRPLIPPHIAVVSESGIRSEADARLVHSCGVDAILVGTELMRTGNIQAKMKELQV
ncbi:indole-3-glycerol phosphate synthase TrpC [candidate division GN15 bacterium]|uniref:Indole-3-glycerol phosphate synthase n=1 Tax=candidate division GN15 bacterium TaxID=2072418 RepID=A0A855X4D2_9BACT|nr:MAG: indole-3-glycerol phosphate synthase TrpC [candidate division GN15 bacterium]